MRLAGAMGLLRASLLAPLISTLAWADKPAAAQVCFTLPTGVSLFVDKPQLNYRAIAPDTYLLDLDLRFNGALPERLTRDGASCLRAWLPAVKVKTVEASFERTTLNLSKAERKVAVELKADLWSPLGQLTVDRAPWVRFSTGLPGQRTLERVTSTGAVPITDFERVPAGTYRVRYEAPPLPTGTCAASLRAVGVGTIRADNRPAQFEALVEQYRRDFLPEIQRTQKLACTELESLEVEVKIFDGIFRAPYAPGLRRVAVPSKQPRYVLRVDGAVQKFESGERFDFEAGQQVVLEQLASGATMAAVN
jgi:hypothetical protein